MYFEILNSAVHWFREPADLMGGQFPRDRHNTIRGSGHYYDAIHAWSVSHSRGINCI